MSEVTHAKCPRCNSFEPVIWTHVKIAEVHATGEVGEFVGMECKCRTCQFEITSLGSVSHRRIAADAA